jgi:hypothetical protein
MLSTRLRLGEYTAALGTVALAVLTFLPWYSGSTGNRTAWQLFSVVDVLIVLAVLGGVAMTVTAVAARTVGPAVSSAVWTVLLGLMSTVAILVQVVFIPSGETGRCAGSWLGLLASALILIGAWLSIRDERTHRYLPDATPPQPAPPA